MLINIKLFQPNTFAIVEELLYRAMISCPLLILKTIITHTLEL